MVACYAFEAKGIQEYVLGSGKLRDMVGASALIENLLGEPLDRALDVLGLSTRVRFTRKAGGAFYALVDDPAAARSLRELWSLIVPHHAPGLEFVHAVEQGADDREAVANAVRRLRAERFPRPELPAGTPFMRYNPRTGRAAAWVAPGPDGPEWLDEAAARKRDFSQKDALAKRLDIPDLRWPVDMERDFPFVGDHRYVGVIHADGNGLGQLIRTLHERVSAAEFQERFRSFSETLAEATLAAAREAAERTLCPAAERHGGVAPARPLVLGGDDLTFIVRGDLALPFVSGFLEAFENNTRALGEIAGAAGGLTACAGVAFVKASQPFALAYELAESLCGRAKDATRRQASAVAFHRVTTSFIPDADWMMREMTREAGDLRFVATLGAYAVGNRVSGLPALADLRDLVELLRGSDGEPRAAGRFRQLLGLLQESPLEARRQYARWRNLMKDGHKGDPRALDRFSHVMARLLGGEPDEELPGRKTTSGWQSPLGDALALLAVEGAGEEQ